MTKQTLAIEKPSRTSQFDNSVFICFRENRAFNPSNWKCSDLDEKRKHVLVENLFNKYFEASASFENAVTLGKKIYIYFNLY